MRYTSHHVLSSVISNLPSELQQALGQGSDLPKREFLQKPYDDGSFILPIKQSFMKDARLMPGTRCMLALLVGWSGRGRGLQVTQARIAKHLGRSVRQVYRYLKDAANNGYLTYNYTKTRIGLITGIRIFLDFSLLRAQKKTPAETPDFSARTQTANTNQNKINIYKKDEELERRLASLEQAMLSKHQT